MSELRETYRNPEPPVETPDSFTRDVWAPQPADKTCNQATSSRKSESATSTLPVLLLDNGDVKLEVKPTARPTDDNSRLPQEEKAPEKPHPKLELSKIEQLIKDAVMPKEPGALSKDLTNALNPDNLKQIVESFKPHALRPGKQPESASSGAAEERAKSGSAEGTSDINEQSQTGGGSGPAGGSRPEVQTQKPQPGTTSPETTPPPAQR